MSIAIIGAGPAGIMAAIAASKNCKDVYLIDKNIKIGKKLFITGKGRCNFSNNSDMSEFYDKIIRNPKFLYSSFTALTNHDLINFFESNGLSTKVERGNRVFPKSDKSSDIIKILNQQLIKNGVRILLNTDIKTLNLSSDGFILNNKEEFDKVILTTGGCSYPLTGSDGSGYLLAKAMGHTVLPPVPALVGIELKDCWFRDVQGISLRNVELIVKETRNTIFHQRGELLFTHYGISGPLSLSASSFMDENKQYDLFIDMKPALTPSELDKRILRDFSKYNNKSIKNSLGELLPLALIPVVLNISDINFNKKVNEITKKERAVLSNTIKNLPLCFKSLRPLEEGIVTRGGIPVSEIHASTLESKIQKDLYFAGEIIDVDALTGGYNLQIAFSTGYLAGKSAGE